MPFANPSLLKVWVLLAACAPAQGYTYWVDASCYFKMSTFDTVMGEAIDMATRAQARMNNYRDLNQVKAFELLWNPSQAENQTFFDEVNRMLHSHQI